MQIVSVLCLFCFVLLLFAFEAFLSSCLVCAIAVIGTDIIQIYKIERKNIILSNKNIIYIWHWCIKYIKHQIKYHKKKEENKLNFQQNNKK